MEPDFGETLEKGRRRLPSLAEEIVQGLEFSEDRLRRRGGIWMKYRKKTLKQDAARSGQCRSSEVSILYITQKGRSRAKIAPNSYRMQKFQAVSATKLAQSCLSAKRPAEQSLCCTPKVFTLCCCLTCLLWQDLRQPIRNLCPAASRHCNGTNHRHRQG